MIINTSKKLREIIVKYHLILFMFLREALYDTKNNSLLLVWR